MKRLFTIIFAALSLPLPAMALAKKMPVILAMCFVGIFGTFHGYAHGLEVPAVAKALPYASGFVTAAGIGLEMIILMKDLC